ncbi:MAG: hypothetical protein LC808_30185 [Actinobacteria bacterium]|nr:hypothetical protein [Actinomycetota bacterium]
MQAAGPQSGRSDGDTVRGPGRVGNKDHLLDRARAAELVATLTLMPHRLRSDEAFELETFWWRPDRNGRPPDDGSRPPSHGTLRFTPDHGVELTVFDLLGDLNPLQGVGRLPALFGETLDHKPCVLFDALPLNQSGDLSGAHHRLVLRGHQFVFGEHVSDPNGVESKVFDVRLRGLRQWLTTGHCVESGQVRHGLSREGTPGGLSIELPGSQLTLGFDWSERGGQVTEEHATATFAFEEPVALNEFVANWLQPLQDLMVLATREQSVLESLRIQRYDERRAEQVHPAIRVAASSDYWNSWNVEVVRTPNVRLRPSRESEYRQILLPASALADDLDRSLRRWYELRWELREAGTSFFNNLNQDSAPLNRRLLDGMSFAETYHRLRHAGEAPLAKKEHRRLRDLMLECIGDHPERERYKRALDYANRPDNIERIADLFARARSVDFAVDVQEETLPAQLVATRNYLIHWGDRTTKVLDGVHRFHAVRRLMVVLEVNLLLDLGLAPDLVKACVDESYLSAVWEDEQ